MTASHPMGAPGVLSSGYSDRPGRSDAVSRRGRGRCRLTGAAASGEHGTRTRRARRASARRPWTPDRGRPRTRPPPSGLAVDERAARVPGGEIGGEHVHQPLRPPRPVDVGPAGVDGLGDPRRRDAQRAPPGWPNTAPVVPTLAVGERQREQSEVPNRATPRGRAPGRTPRRRRRGADRRPARPRCAARPPRRARWSRRGRRRRRSRSPPGSGRTPGLGS